MPEFWDVPKNQPSLSVCVCACMCVCVCNQEYNVCECVRVGM